MKDMISITADMWNRYWNGSGYLYLLLVCCVLLLLADKGTKNGVKTDVVNCKPLVVYQLLVLIIYFCPISAWIIQKCIGSLVYWRMIWLFPVIPIVSLGLTSIVNHVRGYISKAIFTAGLLVVVALAGTSVWQAGNYVSVGNRQQIPDEIARISEVIVENRTSPKSLSAVDDYVASYIRVYDSSIKMPYGREGRGAISPNARYLYRTIIKPEPSVKKIAVRAYRENCEFVVFQIHTRKAVRIMKLKGYGLLEKIGDYGVFQRIKR